MEFGVLGPLELRAAGAEVTLGAPKLRALVIALVLEVGRAVPTDRLVDDLWGEQAGPQSVASLRSYVSNLRRVLVDGDNAPLIVTRGPGYLLDVPEDRVDAVRFERGIGRARLLVDDDPAAGIAEFDAALALWRGPPLLDVADLPFARASVARLGELLLAAREDRLDALLSIGRHTEVVAEAEALATDQPLRERPRAQLMLALYRTGRTAEALAVHRDFRTELADELGLDPSLRFEELASAILRRDPALEPPRGAPKRPAGDAAPPADAGRPPGDDEARDSPGTGQRTAGSGALVGRRTEQERLDSAVAEVARGRGGVLLLAGEPGIGKTSLLGHVVEEAHRLGPLVAWGWCHDARSAPPFWPWVQIIRSVAEVVDDAELARCTAGAAGGVVHLVPELVERTGPRTPIDSSDPHAARFALCDAVATFLGRIAEPRGLVVVVDDLHWGDVATLELCTFLGARAAADRILFTGSYRDTASDRSPELDATLAGLARVQAAGTLRIGGLSEQEVGRLVTRVVGAPVDPETAGVMCRRAGGNPFFVRQLAELHAESEGEVTADAVPVGVHHVLLQRLGGLPDDVRRTLDVASVFGQQVDARPVALCRELALSDVLDHLDVAARHGLMEATGGATGWRFVHALIRDALYGQLPSSRAVRMHASAAAALEQQPRPPVQAIAEHLWVAADLVDPDRAITWLRAAAEEALALYAHEHGERYLRQALHLLAHRPDASPALELEVRLRLVQVLVGLHGWSADGIAEVAARARELAGEAGVGRELTALWWSRWALSMTRGDLGEADELSSQLLADVLEHGGPAEHLAGHVAVAYTRLFHACDPALVISHLEEAERAEARADPALLPITPERLVVSRRIALALARAFAGDARAIAAIEDAVRTAQDIAVPFAEAYARMFGGFVGALLDDPDAASALTEPGIQLCEQMGLAHLGNLTIPTHAWACAARGADATAESQRIAAAIAGLSAARHRHAAPFWNTLHAETLIRADDPVGAQRALDTGRALAIEIGEQVYDGPMARAQALIDGATDRVPRRPPRDERTTR